MSGRYFVGIDPGIDGALAVLDEERRPILVRDLPTLEVKAAGRKTRRKRVLDHDGIATALSIAPPGSLVACERVSLMPHARDGESDDRAHRGVFAAAALFEAFGFLRGLCLGTDLEFRPVAVVSWRALAFGSAAKLYRDRDARHEAARSLAIERWPSLEGDLRFKKNHNRAEALLIASWAWSQAFPDRPTSSSIEGLELPL